MEHSVTGNHRYDLFIIELSFYGINVEGAINFEQYFLYQHDIHRKPQGLIMLDESCRISKAEGANTFEIATTNCNENSGKNKTNKCRSYYLTADSQPLMEDWVRILQNVIQRNALQLLLKNRGNNHDGSTNSTEEGSTNSTLEAWVTKVKHGHAKKVWYAK